MTDFIFKKLESGFKPLPYTWAKSLDELKSGGKRTAVRTSAEKAEKRAKDAAKTSAKPARKRKN